MPILIKKQLKIEAKKTLRFRLTLSKKETINVDGTALPANDHFDSSSDGSDDEKVINDANDDKDVNDDEDIDDKEETLEDEGDPPYIPALFMRMCQDDWPDTCKVLFDDIGIQNNQVLHDKFKDLDTSGTTAEKMREILKK